MKWKDNEGIRNKEGKGRGWKRSNGRKESRKEGNNDKLSSIISQVRGTKCRTDTAEKARFRT